MKKFRIISILGLLTLSIVLIIWISKPKPISKNTNIEAMTSSSDLSFAVLGDVHENIDHFQEAINDLYTINPNMDALILNGDVVDQGLDEQYKSVEKTLEKNSELLPKIIIKNIGNHEFFDYNIETNSSEQVQSFINKYLNFSGEEKVYHDKWINNYHFISLGSEDGNSETMNSVTASISNEQLAWFKEKMAEKYEKGKPIFVFLHQHIDFGNSSWVGVKQSDEIKEILAQYPEAIVFSSHTHRNLTEDSIYLNNPYTIVHTGAVHYTIIPDSSSENGFIRDRSFIKGIYIEVNGNEVTVKGRDIKEKEWIFSTDISK